MESEFDPKFLCMGCMEPLAEADSVCPLCGFDNANGENEPHQLSLRSILSGKYLVGRALGQGGFGITYIGWDLNLDVKVAIKEYYPTGLVGRDLTGHATVVPFMGAKTDAYHDGRDRFVREAKAVAKFGSLPSIVNVRDYFKENGTAYIVMEFVAGKTLLRIAQESGGKLPAQEALSLIRPLLPALRQVHEANLLHRDISPDNIILQTSYSVKLLDFGAAREISTDGQRSLTINVKHGFAPEEQYRTHGEQGPWTDVYALCATIYRLSTGVNPPSAMDRAMGEAPLIPPNELGADFSAAQQEALLHGLAVRAKERTQDMATLENELFGNRPRYGDMPAPRPEPIRKAEPAIGPAPDKIENNADKKDPGNKKKRKTWIVLTAAVLVLAILIAFIVPFTMSPYHQGGRLSAIADDYEDERESISGVQYEQAEKLLASGDIAGALQAFADAGDYKDAKERILDIHYVQAEKLLAKEDFTGALQAFADAGDYEDAKERILGVHYLQAEKLLAEEDFAGALQAFAEAGDYKDARERILGVHYVQAEKLLVSGDIAGALQAFANAGDYEDAKERILGVHYAQAEKLLASGDTGGALQAFANADDYKDTRERIFAICQQSGQRIAAGIQHTVGLKSDGTVVATGNNFFDACDVEDWTDVDQIAAGANHTVGLKSDGRIVTTGENYDGQCNVQDWTDIVQIAAGSDHTVGLKSDGRVVARGDNRYAQCSVQNWTDIVQIAAGDSYTVGLKSDGTVVATGSNYSGKCNVWSWTDIIQIAAGGYHTVGLKSDGTVVSTVDNNDGQCNVQDWTDIVQIAAGYAHTIGLKSDGTVVAAGDNARGQCNVQGWTDIVQITAGESNTVGLRLDGTVVARGRNDKGQCMLMNWHLW